MEHFKTEEKRRTFGEITPVLGDAARAMITVPGKYSLWQTLRKINNSLTLAMKPGEAKAKRSPP